LISQQISGKTGSGKGFKIDIEESILIIDEGHNISENSDEMMSFQIESSTLQECLRGVRIFIKIHIEVIYEY
jgi:Rad3-related DNA helicase